MWAMRNSEEEQLPHKKAYLVVCIISFVISILLCLCDVYLLSFHVYLIAQNLSTYKYIRNMQNRGSSKVIKQIKREDAAPLSDSSVQPQKQEDLDKPKVSWSDVLICGACAPRSLDEKHKIKTNSLVPEKQMFLLSEL